MTLKFILTIQNISHYSNVTWVSSQFVFWSNTTWQNTKGTLWLGIMKTPYILDINIRRMWVSSFMIWLSFSNGNSLIYLLDSRVNGPQSKWWQKEKLPYFAGNWTLVNQSDSSLYWPRSSALELLYNTIFNRIKTIH